MIKYAIFENLDKAKSILNKREIPLDDPLFLKIKKRLVETNRLGYIGWIIGLIYEKNQSEDGVFGILESVTQPAFKETSTWFTKSVTDIESVEEFTDQLNLARNRKLAKNMWLKFPSEQKKLIDWEDSESSALLVRLWDVRYQNLLASVSQFKSPSSLISAIKKQLSSINSDLDGFKDICESNRIKIVYLSYENDILIANVKDHNEVNLLAKDSSWCIRSKDNFNHYNSDHDFYGIKIPKRQYIIINTDEEGDYRKIGVTIGMDITHCSSWSNKGIGGKIIIDYVKNKGFDIKDLFIKIDQDKINEQWIIENLKNKIDFSNFMQIISTFKIDIKDRMGCWKYINQNGINLFYNKEEIEELSYDILFIEYLSKGSSYPELRDNPRYLLKVLKRFGFSIINSKIKIREDIDKLELVLTYFYKVDINTLLKENLLLDGFLVYSKYEMLEKHGYVMKNYTPSLGDVIHISKKEVYKNIDYITQDIIKNLHTYHKMGFGTIQNCLDIFFEVLKEYSKGWLLDRKILDIFYLNIPDNESKKEIFDLYFSEISIEYDLFERKYNIFDMETISDNELRENIDLMPRISETDKTPFIFNRILDVCGEEEAIKYFLKSDIPIDKSDYYLNGLFYDIIEYIKDEGGFKKRDLGLPSLNKLNKVQIISVIESNKFNIDLSKPEISEKIIDYNIPVEISVKNVDVFKGSLTNFFDVFYDKNKYNLFSDICNGNRISNRSNEENSSILICECWLLLWLDEKIKYDGLLEYFIDKYLREGSDNDIKEKLIPVDEDIEYSSKVKYSVKEKDKFIKKCDELLEKPEKVSKNWSDIVINICGSLSNLRPNITRFDIGYVEPHQLITEEIINSQLEKFKNFSPEVISYDVFRSEKLKSTWKMIKPGSKVINSFYGTPIDAYLLSQALLDKNPKTRLEKVYELVTSCKSFGGGSVESIIDGIYNSCIDDLKLDKIIDFIESKPNNRLNKKVNKYLVEKLISRNIRKKFSKRLIDLAMITLDKRVRISWGIEERK